MFLSGEGISVETIARMLKAAGIDELSPLTSIRSLRSRSFRFPAKTVSAIPLLAEYFVQKGFKGAFALSPDKGAMYIAEQAQKVLGGDADIWTSSVTATRDKQCRRQRA